MEAMAEKKVPIAVPESSSVTLELPRKNFENKKTQKAESSAPAKAKKVAGLKKLIAERGRSPDRTAPKVAPEQTPIMPGSASGLRKKPWNTAPVPPSRAPHIMLIRMRGSLIFEMIIASVLEQVLSRTDSGEIKRVPMQSAIKPSITRIMAGNILRTNPGMHFAFTVALLPQNICKLFYGIYTTWY